MYYADLKLQRSILYKVLKFCLRILLEVYRTITFYNTKSLITLQALKSSDTLIIVGNGPSINEMDLSFLHRYDTLTVNAFHTKAQALGLKPTFHMVEDHLPAFENKEELKEFDCGILLIPTEFEWMYPATKSECLKFNFIRSALKFRFLKKFEFSKKFERRCLWGGTVLFAALQLGFRLQYKRVVLIGVDLTYHIPDDAIIDGHVIQTIGADPNHFDQSYFGYGKRWHLPEVGRMQLAFNSALEHYDKVGFELVNGGIGGNLKNIPRINYRLL